MTRLTRIALLALAATLAGCATPKDPAQQTAAAGEAEKKPNRRDCVIVVGSNLPKCDPKDVAAIRAMSGEDLERAQNRGAPAVEPQLGR